MAAVVSQSTSHHLEIPGNPGVIVLSGWGGAGKTKTISRALEGLSAQVSKVGVIINERNSSSVSVDLERLPKGFERLGLHGCACCSQLSDVLAGIKRFGDAGRSLTFIEQSPLSVTSDLKQALRQKGYSSAVIFLFNPAQFQDAPAVHVQGMRDADIVVVTHSARDSSAAAAAERVVEAARRDLGKIPVFIDADPVQGFSRELWMAASLMIEPSKAGLFSSVWASLKMPAAKPSEFVEERQRLITDYSELTLRCFHDKPEQLLEAVEALARKGVVLSRVKGFLPSGVELDVVKEGGRFRLSASPVAEANTGVISVRSFNVQLGKHLGLLASHVGTPDLNPILVRQVVGGYPTTEELRQQLASSKVVPMGFEPDRLLSDLLYILPNMKDVPLKARQQELGNGLVACLKASVEARLNLISEISANPSVAEPARSLGLLNAHFFLSSLLHEKNLSFFFAKHPLLMPLRERAEQLRPSESLVTLLGQVPHVRLEGRRDLSRRDAGDISRIIRSAQEQGLVSSQSVAALLRSFEVSKDVDVKLHLPEFRRQLA